MKCDECPINKQCMKNWELECDYCKHNKKTLHEYPCNECESITDCKFELREGE
jgi:hypothetical protein